MTSTPRERVWNAIRHVEPDRVPYHLSFTLPARGKLEAHYGSPDLDETLDNHLVKYKPRARKPGKKSGRTSGATSSVWSGIGPSIRTSAPSNSISSHAVRWTNSRFGS